MCRIHLIAAMSKNYAIGKNGAIPWHVPGELSFFKETTLNSTVVMGRKTWESLPKAPLPDRRNIVFSHSSQVSGADAVYSSVAEVLENEKGNIFVIGGSSVYQQFMGFAERAYITEVDMVVEGGDTSFPVHPSAIFSKKSLVREFPGAACYLWEL